MRNVTMVILTVLVMVTTVRGQRHRREVIRSQNGLFYHQGPYLSHSHRQVTRQAPASFHRSALFQSHHHTSTPVRFPQHNFPATGGQTQALKSSNFNIQRTHQGHKGFIGPVLPPQPHQPLLSPVVSPPMPAPALTFLENTIRQKPQQLGHQTQQLGHQTEQLGHQTEQLRHQNQQLGHQNQQLSSPPAQDHKPSSALDNLMAIAGYDWDLTTGGSPGPGPEVFQCPALEGHFRSPTDCAVYYQCAQGRAHRRSCDTGLAYNGLTNQCDWPENVKC